MRRGLGRRRRSATAAVVALLAAGCANDAAEPAVAAATAPATASPSPSVPPRPAAPTAGGRSYSQWSGSSTGILLRRDAAAGDDAAIDTLMTAVGDWLDDHLADLFRGGPGLLEEVAAPGLLEGTAPELLGAATTALSSPDDPAVSARYDLRAHHDGAPEWVTADAVVTRWSGAVGRTVFVFAPGEQGPVLLLFGPEPAP